MSEVRSLKYCTIEPDKTSDIGEIVHKVRNDREECCNLLIPWHHFQEVSDVHML